MKIFPTIDPWEIIIQDEDCDPPQEFSLKIDPTSLCPLCFYPLSLSKICKHHPGLELNQNKISVIIGNTYDTDYSGNATNWYTEDIQKISMVPFKYSHSKLKLVLSHRLHQFKLTNLNILFATMAPTENHQMRALFEEVSVKKGIKWIEPEKIFTVKKNFPFSKKRALYVKKKYSLSQNASQIVKSFIQNSNTKEQSVIIFDDVFHTGYTLGRCTELLFKTGITYANLIVLGRTTKRQFLKSISFPN